MKKSDRRQAESDLFANNEIVSNFTPSIKFKGTENSRYLRVLRALLVRNLWREKVDQIAGCRNGPALIANLRKLGLSKEDLRCFKLRGRDRDGQLIRRGLYVLSDAGRRAINIWLVKRKGGAQ